MRFMTLAALLCAGAALADDATDTCGHAAQLAASVMQGRQAGASAAQLTADVLPQVPTGSQRLVTEMILTAYEQPRFNTPENQQRAISDFANDVFTSCMRSF